VGLDVLDDADADGHGIRCALGAPGPHDRVQVPLLGVGEPDDAQIVQLGVEHDAVDA